MNVDYPRENVEVVVIADNCSDQTALIAQRCGARVIERYDPAIRGKGDALAYAFAALRDEPFDAYLVLDADTLVEPDLLTVMDRYIESGQRVIQAHYDVLNPFETRRTALMYVAFSIFHYVRPLGRSALGLSTGLKGNGMCFVKDVIDRYPWTAFSLVEDIEYTTTLVVHGERIAFAPEARIKAQMPVGRAQATTQRMRWERGRFQVARRDGPRLLWQGLRRFDLRIFDWGMDLVIPPLAALTIAVMLGMVAAAAVAAFGGNTLTAMLLILWIGLMGALVLFVFASMAVSRAPRRAYRALLSAPAYVAWKLWIYLVMLARPAPQSWVRTGRTRMAEK